MPVFRPAEVDPLASFLRVLPTALGATPRGILVVSAHWEETRPTLMSGSAPPLYYDYFGFPPEAYTLSWPAKGDPQLAAQVRELLDSAGLPSSQDPDRGYDHGTFVPLKLMYPQPTIPVIQLSLLSGLDPARHLALGRALAPLRDEGVLILGSGMSYHHLPNLMRGRGQASSRLFDDWLQEAVCGSPPRRTQALLNWQQAPAARDAHPREEHLLPLLVVAGAAEEAPGQRIFHGTFMDAWISAFRLG
ncbi:MAG: dioxygenase [Calditrichaeota bacterium]|nr:dioxygenase [Candidatus Cloacimonadota bacterium]MCA9787484.1 dioxygenase [Candidatus Cloacimonadota bacterium]MCB1046456.1 dioxygenase [Calditrichota bacterium]MCB9474884.1 dioxygenase [Candidatus Delongbacteria bacterium]